ncbi:beta-lactoglobulin isoform 1-T1 [Molossus nigricans]
MKRGHRLPGLPSPWAPGIMALETGPLLLLALSLGLASAQKTLEGVPVQPGFDAHKVEGRWLTIRLAASQARLVSPTDPLRLALHSIETRDRDLELVLFWRGENVCRRVSVTIHPTGQPGQYQGSSPTTAASSFTSTSRTAAARSPACGRCWPGECPGTPSGWGSTWSTSGNSGCRKRLSSTWTPSVPHLKPRSGTPPESSYLPLRLTRCLPDPSASGGALPA